MLPRIGGDTVNKLATWQDRVFHGLAMLYGIVAFVALKGRYFATRKSTCSQGPYMSFRPVSKSAIGEDTTESTRVWLDNSKYFTFSIFWSMEIVQHILLDVPSLAFFTTYALLVLFWAEIYSQYNSVGTSCIYRRIKAHLLHNKWHCLCHSELTNMYVNGEKITVWLIRWRKLIRVLTILSKMLFAVISLFAALGFLLYGGRLFLMLQRFPVESKGRRKKLQEVGYVTTICFSCFLIRCVLCDAFDPAADLDVLDHPILNFMYYLKNKDDLKIFMAWRLEWQPIITSTSMLQDSSKTDPIEIVTSFFSLWRSYPRRLYSSC